MSLVLISPDDLSPPHELGLPSTEVKKKHDVYIKLYVDFNENDPF